MDSWQIASVLKDILLKSSEDADLGLVEAEVLRPGDGSLWWRRQILPGCTPPLDLRVYALQHLRAQHTASKIHRQGTGA